MAVTRFGAAMVSRLIPHPLSDLVVAQFLYKAGILLSAEPLDILVSETNDGAG